MSQFHAKERAEKQGLSIVGWYHRFVSNSIVLHGIVVEVKSQ